MRSAWEASTAFGAWMRSTAVRSNFPSAVKRSRNTVLMISVPALSALYVPSFSATTARRFDTCTPWWSTKASPIARFAFRKSARSSAVFLPVVYRRSTSR